MTVSATYDKPSYNQGDTMVVTISGTEVHTVTTQSQVGPITIPLVSADGNKTTVNVPVISVSVTTAHSDSMLVDTSLPIVDNSPTPRTWTVSSNRLSISAVA